MDTQRPGRGPLSPHDRLFLWFFYFVRSFRYDLPENKVGWRSRQNQEARFRALAGIGELGGRKILDLGCGLGCLYGFLRANGWEGVYRGVDILGLMVRGARRRFPGVDFEKRDILKKPPPEKWDYVLVNGVFNHKVRDNWAWMERMVGAGLALADRGLAFNVLSAEAGWYDPELFYAPPGLLEEKAKAWSGGKYRMVSGYMPEDITVYLYK